jgi:hypothetical protein
MSSTTSSSSPPTTAASTPQPSSNVKYTLLEPTPANITQFTTHIASAFHSTPLTTIFIGEIDADPETGKLACPPFSHARRYNHFYPGIDSAAQSGAEVVEAGDFSALALWEAPDFQGKPFVEAREKFGEIFLQWRDAARRMKATYLATPGEEDKIRPFYHLSFLARNPDQAAVPGAISAVVLPFLQRARDEAVPAWLEATYPHAVSIYQHFGFRICEEVTVGKGQCDGRGYPSSGEEATGVKAWGMIYDSHLH